MTTVRQHKCPRARPDRLNLSVGDHATLTGRGTQTGTAKGMRVETIALAMGAVVVVDTPPPVPTSVSHAGVVERVFVSPHGDVDSILISVRARCGSRRLRVPPLSSSARATRAYRGRRCWRGCARLSRSAAERGGHRNRARHAAVPTVRVCAASHRRLFGHRASSSGASWRGRRARSCGRWDRDGSPDASRGTPRAP